MGNKCDLEEERQVNKEEGEMYAKQIGMAFRECSAKNSLGVEEAFRGLVQSIINNQ